MNFQFELQTFFEQVSQSNKFKIYLNKALSDYKIRQYNVVNLTPSEIKANYDKIVLKYKQNSQIHPIPYDSYLKEENLWMINQLKVFIWILICLAYTKKEPLHRISQKSWSFLCSVFHFKSSEILEFQLKSLLKNNSHKSDKWREEEEQLLTRIIQQIGFTGKWNQISKLFFFRSQKKYFREAQKCREHWHNHLNPQINHNSWSSQEDIKLIEHVMLFNSKWSQVAKAMHGSRTEHMIKNRYNSLFRRYVKKTTQSDEKLIQQEMIENIRRQMTVSHELNSKMSQESLQIAEKFQMNSAETDDKICNIEITTPQQLQNQKQNQVQIQTPVLIDFNQQYESYLSFEESSIFARQIYYPNETHQIFF